MTTTLAKVIPLPFVAERLHLQERIEDKRRELEGAVALADGLFDGTIHWEQYDPGLTCMNRQEIAADCAARDADDVRKELAALEAQAGGAE